MRCSATRRSSRASTRWRSSGRSWTRSWRCGSATGRASPTIRRAPGARARPTSCCTATGAAGGVTSVATAEQLEGWSGEDVSVAAIERELSRLRTASGGAGGELRTSVMTHVAWVPGEWRQAALDTLAGLAERHPSRAILLLPDPAGEDRIDAEVSLQCFPLHGQERHVCSEVIVLHLRGGMTRSPASIVQPLLITSLPF